MDKYLINILLPSLIFFFAFNLYEKAGRKKWEALIPGYNIWAAIKIIDRPWWWIILFLIPGINIMMFMIVVYRLYLSFGKYEQYKLKLPSIVAWIFYVLKYMLVTTFLAPYYLSKLNFDKKVKYEGPGGDEKYRKLMKKNKTREWTDAVVFAAVAATIIRWFFIEAYTIPTPSMEKSLLVGDFLFVSKINYGPRVPMTPVAFPFSHHTLPKTKLKSYVEWLKMDYTRLPGFQKIKNNDVVVFNYPDGDTVAFNKQNQSYYYLVRENGWKAVNKNKREYGKVIARPVDKRENYIKRCVGIAGDTLQVKNREVYINSKLNKLDDRGMYLYEIFLNNTGTFTKSMVKKLELASTDVYKGYGTYQLMFLTKDKAKIIKNYSFVDSIRIFDRGEDPKSTYPYWPKLHWTVDNYGPIYIPKAGDKITLDQKNYKIYERVIRVYENNPTLEWKEGKAYINGELADTYTFKMNYYWMMGDNRHNSADSRSWGFVPEDHIVGKALFIWLSMDKDKKGFFRSIRWNRFFMGIN